jgi:predicted ATPase
MNRIVLTGGPGSGKTVITTFLAQANPTRFVAVPEAATQVYQAARTRWDLVDLAGKRDLQRRIYHLQIEQESRLAREFPGKTLLLDRGTIDGATYWPDGPTAYWQDLGTNLPAELARYDLVILLQTAAAIGIYDGSESNPVRFEDQAAALANEQILSGLWSNHKNFAAVPASLKLEDKIMAVGAILKSLK